MGYEILASDKGSPREVPGRAQACCDTHWPPAFVSLGFSTGDRSKNVPSAPKLIHGCGREENLTETVLLLGPFPRGRQQLSLARSPLEAVLQAMRLLSA